MASNDVLTIPHAPNPLTRLQDAPSLAKPADQHLAHTPEACNHYAGVSLMVNALISGSGLSGGDLLGKTSANLR